MRRGRQSGSNRATHARATTLITPRVPSHHRVALRVAVLALPRRRCLRQREAARRRRVRVARDGDELIGVGEGELLRRCQEIARGCRDDFHFDGFHHGARLIAEVGTCAGRRQLERCAVALVLLLLVLTLDVFQFCERELVILVDLVTFQCLYAVRTSES